MKRTYTKPLIAMESFQLNASLAAACSTQTDDATGLPGIAIHYGENTCTANEEKPGLGYFGAMCDDNVVDVGGDGNDGICYHAHEYGIFLAS